MVVQHSAFLGDKLFAILGSPMLGYTVLSQRPGGEVERNRQACNIDVALPENLVGSQT